MKALLAELMLGSEIREVVESGTNPYFEKAKSRFVFNEEALGQQTISDDKTYLVVTDTERNYIQVVSSDECKPQVLVQTPHGRYYNESSPAYGEWATRRRKHINYPYGFLSYYSNTGRKSQFMSVLDYLPKVHYLNTKILGVKARPFTSCGM